MFYDLFCELCNKKGISVTKATVEIGLSRTIGTKWKNTGATPNGDTLNKIAEYFGVTTDYLLGAETEKASTPKDERKRKLHSIARLESADITPELDKNIADYIDFLLKKREEQE